MDTPKSVFYFRLEFTLNIEKKVGFSREVLNQSKNLDFFTDISTSHVSFISWFPNRVLLNINASGEN